MFTLRIIFYGLIALAQDGRPEGALALLVRDPGHAASVWMVNGECARGDCARSPGQAGMNEILAGTYRDRGFNLVWFLDQEHLTLEQAESGGWDQTTAPDSNINDALSVFPETRAQSRELIWVPHLSEIAPVAGPLRTDCLGQPQSCPVTARFDVSHGSVSSCHLVHEGHGEEAEVHAFEFRPFGSGSAGERPRAIADAVMVEIKVNAPGVRLASRPFSSETIEAWAELTPRQGRVTLIVSNNDYSGHGSHGHFEHYYALTERGATLSVKPVPYPRSKQRLDPGHCEQILDSFEKGLGVSVDGVHNHRECDMVQIPVW